MKEGGGSPNHNALSYPQKIETQTKYSTTDAIIWFILKERHLKALKHYAVDEGLVLPWHLKIEQARSILLQL